MARILADYWHVTDYIRMLTEFAIILTGFVILTTMIHQKGLWNMRLCVIMFTNCVLVTFMAWDMISHTNRRLIRNLSIRHLPVRMTRTILLHLPARTIRITHRRLQGLMIRIIHQRHPDRMILMTRISIRLSRSRWL